MNQLETLGLIPELQGGEIDPETIRGAREEHLRLILDERDGNLIKTMDDKLNAMEQRLIAALKPQDPDPRFVQDSVAETPVLSRLLAQSNNNVEIKNKNELNRIVNCEH